MTGADDDGLHPLLRHLLEHVLKLLGSTHRQGEERQPHRGGYVLIGLQVVASGRMVGTPEKGDAGSLGKGALQNLQRLRGVGLDWSCPGFVDGARLSPYATTGCRCS